MCVFGAYIHLCVYMYKYETCVLEVRGGCLISFSTIATHWGWNWLVAGEPQWSSCLHSAGVTGVCLVKVDFLCGCWGFELRYLCFTATAHIHLPRRMRQTRNLLGTWLLSKGENYVARAAGISVSLGFLWVRKDLELFISVLTNTWAGRYPALFPVVCTHCTPSYRRWQFYREPLDLPTVLTIADLLILS